MSSLRPTVLPPSKESLSYFASPIHRLNADVLLQIFRLCCDSLPVSIWPISQTCSFWRSLTKEQRILWSHIVLNSHTLRVFKNHPLETRLRTWITRSGSKRPLDIVIDLSDNQAYPYAILHLDKAALEHILRALCYHAPRWRSFSYSVGQESFPLMWLDDKLGAAAIRHLLNRRMPVLQALRFSQDRFGVSYGITPQFIYSLFHPKLVPTLRSITLGNISTAPEMVWKTSQVSYQVIDAWTQHTLPPLVALLETFQHVEKLNLSGYSPDGVLQSLSSGAIELQQLAELKATANAYMATSLLPVKMPNLASLTLDARHIPTDPQVRARSWPRTYQAHSYSLQLLAQLTERKSAQGLVSLVLHLPHRDVPWATISKVSTLLSFRLVKPTVDVFWENFPANLEPLCKKQGDTSLEWYLPRLVELTFEASGRPGRDRDRCASRWNGWAKSVEKQFKHRFRESRGKGAAVARLDIDVCGPDWEFGVQDD